MHGTFDKFNWTPARIDDLKRMIDAKYSASQAAVELGITRNAVIGKTHRLKLAFQSVRRVNVNATVQNVRRRRAKPAYKVIPMEPEPDALLLTVNHFIDGGRGELEAKSCRFIVTDDHPMLYCGHESVGGLSYCAHHARKMYRPAEARERAPRPR